MLRFIKNAYAAIFKQVTRKLTHLFKRSSVDEETLKDLEKILIEADTGIHTTRALIGELRSKIAQGKLVQGADLKQALYEILKKHLSGHPYTPEGSVYLLVGINGSGKTTFAAKLTALLQGQGKKVHLVAADTFRAAATEQLKSWSDRLSADIIIGKPNQDPASVVFTGCEVFKRGQYNALVVDTAGRLQTKVNLMKELEKIRTTITKQLSGTPVTTLLTIDSMLGQNSFDQARLFKESTDVSGIVLTKMDGTAKGGIVFSITTQLHIPIAYITFGEKVDQISLFNQETYLNEFLGI